MSKFLDDIENRDKDKDVWDDESDAVAVARTWVENYKKQIADFYARYDVGVAYPRDEAIYNILEIKKQLSPLPAGELSEEEVKKRDEIIKKSAYALAVATCLDNNGCIVHDDNAQTFTVTQIKPIDELDVVSVSGHVFGFFSPEDLEKAGIALSMKVVVSNTYTVIAGPEYLMIDVDDITDYLSDSYLDLDDDDIDNLIDTISIHHALVVRIMDIVVDGPIAPSDLIEKLFKNEDKFKITFDVIDEAMQSVLTDLKKLEFITIKNGLIKLGK
ncbi:MAG TPA: hypothetical protein O0X32_03305 [Methanocorpusculum sp.]|nr:hypothetical protein [Methanocorpusculum sp.]